MRSSALTISTTTSIVCLAITILQSPILVVKAHYPHDTVDAMAVSNDGSQVFVAVRQTLLQSRDFGTSWRHIRALPQSIKRSYMAHSPYDDSLYVYSGGRMQRTRNLIDWETPAIDACERHYYDYMKRRATFAASGTLVAGWGKIFKDNGNGNGFINITHPQFNICPPLAAVPNSDIVYAGGFSGLMRSDDGGLTWNFLVTMSDIMEVVANDGEVLVMTTTSICRLNGDVCDEIPLPDVNITEKVRDGPSPHTAISYTNGVLYVARANSFALYYTTDLGVTWNTRSQPDDFVTLGHYGKNAWDFEEAEEFTHLDGNYVGSWIGTFRTDDDGNSWTYLDTIRKAITSFSVIKASDMNGGGFTVSACTYSSGCFSGPPTNMVPHPIGTGFYESLHFSPTYDVDGIGFENTKNSLLRLDGTKVQIDRITPGEKSSIKTVVFSPNFNVDGMMFVSGYNIGVLASFNHGQTFDNLIFDGNGDGVVRTVLSTNFTEDGTMACLVDPDFDGLNKVLGDTLYIYVSSNSGATWRRIGRHNKAWRDLIIVAGEDGNPLVVAIQKNGKLFSHSTLEEHDATPLRFIKDSARFSVRPQGYSFDGLAVSPDGSTLAAAFAQGGIAYGSIDASNTLVNKRYSIPTPWRPSKVDPPIVFSKSPDVDDVIGRTFSSHIAFSPAYDIDNTMFAADMFSIYMSTNKGMDWAKMFSLNGGGQ